MAEQLPTEDTQIYFDGREQAADVAQQLIKTAVRQLCFFGPNIDKVLFDHPQTVELISEFARRSPRTEVRLLVFDTQVNISQNHRLLPLAQRLSSKIKIHAVSKKYQSIKKMFLIVDTNAYLFCPNNNVYKGRAEIGALAAVHELQQEFDEIWTHSTPDINTRRLHL